MKIKDKNILHENHRCRVREKIERNGFLGLLEHEKMEYILFNVFARKDTNPIAHKLIDMFGSFDAVIGAPIEKLLTVDGIGEQTASFLHNIPEIFNAINLSKAQNTKYIYSMTDILTNYQLMMQNLNKEKIYIIGLDNNGKVVLNRFVSNGNESKVDFNITNIIKIVGSVNCSNVVLMHNHPDGEANPSVEDVQATQKIYFALNTINVYLIDHIIFNNKGEYYSFSQNGVFEKYNEKFSGDNSLNIVQTKMSAFKRIDKIKKF